MQTQTPEPERRELVEAVAFARQRVQNATDAYEQGGRTLDLLRQKQVAEDELKALAGEQHQYDDDRDVGALYRTEKRGGPRTSRGGWPQGGQWKPPKREYVVSRTVQVERVTSATVPPVKAETRPAALANKPRDKKGGASWWVGADRRQLNAGAQTLATTPPPKTARAASKTTIRKVEDQKRFEQRQTASKTLQARMQPMAGDFAELPLAE